MPIDHSPAVASGSGSRTGDIIALRRRRATLKASCTRIETFVNGLGVPTAENFAQLEERRARLDAIWGDYQSVQTIIEELDAEEAADRAIVEDAVYEVCARIRYLMRPASAPAVQRPRMARGSSESDNTNSTTHIRLPKLNLPSFSGKYDEWFPFCDTFIAIIHNNDTLSNVQKFQYLRASLNGDAINIVRPLEISDRNYDLAWTLLRERYDNKRVVVQAHIRAILELSSMTKESANELRRMSDGVARHVRALNALERPADTWDDLLIHILSAKLDPVTSREWHASLKGVELPTLKQFLEFITHRSQMLEAVDKGGEGASTRAETRSQRPNNNRRQACAATVRGKCGYCAGEHAIYACGDFAALSVDRRIAEVRRRGLCLNCMRSAGRTANRCTSGNCRTCGAKHNALLHLLRAEDGSGGGGTRGDASASARSAGVAGGAAASLHACIERSGHEVLLSTALIYAYSRGGSRRLCRALLDSGSQVSLISRELLEALQIDSHSVDISVSGVCGAVSASNQMARVKLRSRINSFVANIECVVVDMITDKIPAVTAGRRSFGLPAGLALADPRFNVSAGIDMLIGAELFWQLLCVGQIEATREHPVLQKTRLGWILAGRAVGVSRPAGRVSALHVVLGDAGLHAKVDRFWSLETVTGSSHNYTMEERACETHFIENVSTDARGRYIVKLPAREDVLCQIGSSRDIALKRFNALEGRLRRDPVVRSLYVQFLNEYLELGHMRRVDPWELDEGVTVYLPHHGVMKGEGRDAKLRVVFDASCKSSTGVSLNDALMVGPVVQQDLISILVRFRSFAYAFTADVVKMYRQILIDASQYKLQRILWRDDPGAPIDTYELLTVTYGTSSASFLATRCIQHAARKYATEYPLGSERALRDFYVDDLLTGADTISEAERVRDEIIELLRHGRFELSKWSSNCSALLRNGKDTLGRKNLNKDTGSKVLGVVWEPSDDEFRFEYKRESASEPVTKRAILSEIASLFDPLGLLGPTTVVAKIILQEIWQSGAGWDESLLQDVHGKWLGLKRQLPLLNELRVPRWVGFGGDARCVQLHGFCDASERAYGACVYIRSESGPGQCRVKLLIAKSRVAPVKATSIPRLELSAALLLATLVEKLRSSIDLSATRMVLWTDSTVALQWISSPSRKWTTFVANRVGEIQRLTGVSDWRHVPSACNPADILSRGADPSELSGCSMWWNGPSFLESAEEHWPTGLTVGISSEPPEQKRIVMTVTISKQSNILNLLNNYSSLDKILRIIAYCLRFIRSRRVKYDELYVFHRERSVALWALIRVVQREAFPGEYRAMKENRTIAASSSILALTPFIDEDGIIRVGGRLRNSELPYEARHPILLPRGILARLIVAREHVRSLHAGLQATMCAVRQRFWPLALRSVTRNVIRQCIICFKCKPTASQALMADLPRSRVTMSRPFTYTGVDYAGPISLKESKRRNARLHKAYISMFVCFSTKAVHIELVSDLTADAFLAAFKRFISRRGRPSVMYSDNGTTFVGANRKMSEFAELVNGEEAQKAVREFLNSNEMTWSFIPPQAPHFGGLWEAAVKSAKSHLFRVMGSANLTSEEARTILCEIEAMMNSRPLTPLSDDPNDLQCITPGHFLIGTALNSFPMPDLLKEKEKRLLRWQRVEQIRQHFWRRWSVEYLHTLIERRKWRANKGEECEIGRLALIQQPGLGPLQWLLGRVERIHPGADGIVRAATLKTARGSLTRPVAKLAMFPSESGGQSRP